jgi:nucleoside-diphosphate-sugar epimerase
MRRYRENGFPVTIVRPSHTYDNTLVPTDWGYTVLDRIKRGKKIVVHGDGTSLWVLTHHRDFAVGFNGLLGKKQAVGQTYHITSDELLPWNRIYGLLAREYTPWYSTTPKSKPWYPSLILRSPMNRERGSSWPGMRLTRNTGRLTLW